VDRFYPMVSWREQRSADSLISAHWHWFQIHGMQNFEIISVIFIYQMRTNVLQQLQDVNLDSWIKCPPLPISCVWRIFIGKI
jgi:hypothetical protein